MSIKKCSAIIVVGTQLVFAPAQAGSQPQYFIEEQDRPTGSYSAWIDSVNPQGNGFGQAVYRGVFSPKLYTRTSAGVLTQYDVDTDSFQGLSIAADGQIYGYYRPDGFLSDQRHAAFFDQGVISLLPALTIGYNSVAVAANRRGHTVGYEQATEIVGVPAQMNALLWIDQQPVLLSAGEWGSGAEPQFINDDGTIAGTVRRGLHGGNSAPAAAVWHAGQLIELATPPGATFSRPTSLTQTNQIYGLIEVSDSFGQAQSRFVVWDTPKDEPRTLYDFGAMSVALLPGIADDGTAVGSTYLGDVPSTILIHDGELLHLSDLLINPDGWQEFWGASITADGRLFGVGVKDDFLRGFIATPVTIPEPGGLVAVVGLVGLGMRRRGRDRRAGE